MLIAFCPAGKMEQFFRSVGANPKLNADPEFFQKCEMELVGPSSFWNLLKPAWPSTRPVVSWK